jgi:hypothetical protein
MSFTTAQSISSPGPVNAPGGGEGVLIFNGNGSPAANMVGLEGQTAILAPEVAPFIGTTSGVSAIFAGLDPVAVAILSVRLRSTGQIWPALLLA